jgi:hypothetical protein
MTEAYGLVGVAPANSLHGAYADALEALDARRAAAGAGDALLAAALRLGLSVRRVEPLADPSQGGGGA